MKCKHCNVEVYGKADFCPLCKQPLTDSPNEYNNEYIYPIKKKRGKSYKLVSFTPIYMIVSALVFVIAILVNFLAYSTSIRWCWMVGLVLLYAYILVENTIRSRHSIANKVLWQAIFLFAFLWVLGFLLYQTDVIEVVWYMVLDIALPTVIGLSNFVMCVVTACLVKKDKSLIVDCIWFSITGFLPIILYWAGVIEYSYIAIAVAVLSLIQLLVMLIAGRKYLKRETEYKFRV